MFGTLRKARFANIALLLAGFVSVSSSFGLHPEPNSRAGPATSRAGSTKVNLSDPAAPHDCLACLAHRSISLPGLSAVVLQAGSGIMVVKAAAPSLLGRLEATLDEGRAPPALD